MRGNTLGVDFNYSRVPREILDMLVALAVLMGWGGMGERPGTSEWRGTIAPERRSAAARSTLEGSTTGAFRVREGYRVSVALDDLPNARFLEQDDAGRLYISRFTAPVPPRAGGAKANDAGGDITCATDADGDGVYESRVTFLTGPEFLHGLAWHDGWLWYTTSGSIRKARDTSSDGVADDNVVVIGEDRLPSGGAHWWRSIAIAHGRIYTSIGDSGNITDEIATDRQKIWSYALDGSDRKIFASGIRNTEKLRVRPGTTELWGLDHGSDWFGKIYAEDPANPAKGMPFTDDNPGEEINKYVEGGFYGHPFIVGGGIPRPEFASRSDIVELGQRAVAPELLMPAHWAGNGFCFVTLPTPERGAERAESLPRDHAGDMIACYHGSWNRSEPGGYCVVRVMFDANENRPIGYVKLVDGLDKATKGAILRPVDAIQRPDGSVLFSCDLSGRVYRLCASEK